MHLFHCDGGGAVSADCAESLRQFSEKYQDCFHKVCDVSELPAISGDDVLIDGLFGSGLNRPLQGFYAEVVKFVNNADCTVFAIDIPSGLMGEDREEGEKQVQATSQLCTFTESRNVKQMLCRKINHCPGSIIVSLWRIQFLRCRRITQ